MCSHLNPSFPLLLVSPECNLPEEQYGCASDRVEMLCVLRNRMRVLYMILTGSNIICDVRNACTGVCFDLPPKPFDLSRHLDP